MGTSSRSLQHWYRADYTGTTTKSQTQAPHATAFRTQVETAQVQVKRRAETPTKRNESQQGYFCCRRCWQQSQEEHLSQDTAGISVPQGLHVQNQCHPLSSLHYPTRIFVLPTPHVQKPLTRRHLVQPQDQQNHITMKKTNNLCQKGIQSIQGDLGLTCT